MFEFIKVLGKGTFGKVILCRERSTDHLLAMKVLQKSVVIREGEVAHTLAERNVLRKTKHPFLIVSTVVHADKIKSNKVNCYVSPRS
jgi:RAC serine/threonine-protein kinase